MTLKSRSAPHDRQQHNLSEDNLSLFPSGALSSTPHLDNEARVQDAERILLQLADFIYAHTPLKPMSKTLFFLSRALVTGTLEAGVFDDLSALSTAYHRARKRLGTGAPNDDFDFGVIIEECGQHIPRIMDSVKSVLQLTSGTDNLGLAFNTLLRGKWEGGEGLGTFLTPEEVVEPMVDILIDAVGPSLLKRIGPEELLFGDICGGTGRFVFSMAQKLRGRGAKQDEIESCARLFDQSSLAVGFAKVNFALDGLRPRFSCVGDSLVAKEVSQLTGRFLLLATNPPFGLGKYTYSPQLKSALPRDLLNLIGLTSPDDSADPSELFLYRNLSLLAPGGALAIVLPDGVIQSSRLPEAFDLLEQTAKMKLNVEAAVSLPAATFSLGGTVAKTSFLVIRSEKRLHSRGLYVADAKHVGFLKRGNRRAADPQGNDLLGIAAEWSADHPIIGRRIAPEKKHRRLAIGQLIYGASQAEFRGRPLREIADEVRTPLRKVLGADPARFHVSILDIDETGLIDVVAASRNQPATPPRACNPGDVLVSCINPKIWRVAVIPNLEGGTWSCSSEFLVLRPRKPSDAWSIGVALHHSSVIAVIQSMAGGTSSSRQRVAKKDVLGIDVPAEVATPGSLDEHVRIREDWYSARLREAEAYDRLHAGDEEFLY